MEEMLIEAVRSRQVLYDTNHENYMRTKLKTKKWEEIAKEVGIKTGTEAKALWEKLRHSLRDALRRQKKCFKSGMQAGDIKEWKFQKQMAFLQPYMANKSRGGNPQEDSGNENLADHFEENVMSGKLDDEYLEENSMIESLVESVDDEAQPVITEALTLRTLETLPSTATMKSVKRFKKDNVSSLLKQKRENRAKARLEERKNMFQEFRPQENNPLFHFFMAMYQSTKEMPPLYQHMVRNLVFSAVSGVEAKLLDFAGQQQPHSGSAQLLHSGPGSIQQPQSGPAQTAHQFQHPGPGLDSTHSLPGYSYSENPLFSTSEGNIRRDSATGNLTDHFANEKLKNEIF